MVVEPTAAAIAQAVGHLQAGEVLGMPTETVYGLAGDATNAAAVSRIFALKGRPLNHPVIVHVADAEAAAAWAHTVTPRMQRLMARFWPGPLTLIVRRASHVPDAITGGQDTVGLRCPAHPVAQALLHAFAEAGGSGAVAAPSANRFGRVSPTRASHVVDEFGTAVPMVLDGGPCDVGIESTILDISRAAPVLLRPGAILASELAECLQEVVRDPHQAVVGEPNPRVSGALTAHYAPLTALELVAREELDAIVRRYQAQGERLAVWAAAQTPVPQVSVRRTAPGDAEAYARQLYATLRELDATGCDRILIERPPSGPAWQGIHDRLARAAAGSGPAAIS